MKRTPRAQHINTAVGFLGGFLACFVSLRRSELCAPCPVHSPHTEIQAPLDPFQDRLTDISVQCANSETASANEWAGGIAFELNHHAKWIAGISPWLGPGEWYAKERQNKLAGRTVQGYDEWICGVMSEHGIKANIMLDHGAGPFTNLGSRFRCNDTGADALVVNVDPLAPAYHGVLNRAGIYNTQRPSFCKSEDLLKCFCPGTFDLAIIVNALDHSENAVLGWMNAVQVTRQGGLTCIVTLKNEAKHMGQQGFHQWNFDVSTEGSLVFHNMRTGEATDMSKRMQGLAQQVFFQHTPAEEFGVLRACWKKN